MTLPKKISPCPIIDSLLEIRFATNFPPNAIFGIVYNALKGDFEKTENLPILQLPEPIRTVDPNFKFKPHFKISNKNFVVQIGPDVISISSYPTYLGWEIYSKEIFRILKIVNELLFIASVLRVGFRVINFFNNDIFANTKLKIQIDNKDIEYDSTLIRTTINSSNNIKSVFNITNDAILNGKKGFVVDIDTFKTTELSNFFSNPNNYINDLHQT